MVKIVYLTENFKDTVRQDALYYLEQEVGKLVDCRWTGKGWRRHKPKEPMDRTVKRVMPDADWVIYFIFETIARRNPVIIPPKEKRSYKVAAYTVDLHRDSARFLNWVNQLGLDAALMTSTRLAKNAYQGEILPISPDYFINRLNMPFFHMAPAINPEIYKPANGEKCFDVTFLGAVTLRHYPLRCLIWEELPDLAKKEGWRTLIRNTPPGLAINKKISGLIKSGYFVGRKYADALAYSKIFLFGTSVFKYPLMKFYEGMACGACVMSDVPLSAEELHLIPDWNFVAVDEDNWKEKLKYYLKHDAEREEIAKRGYETVMKYHTAKVRAKQLVQFLEEHA